MLDCEECLPILHVRPVTRDDSQAFAVSRCFFVRKFLIFGPKRLERLVDPAALGAIWTRAHNKVMGLNFEAKNAPFMWSTGSKVPFSVVHFTFPCRLQGMKIEFIQLNESID